LAKTCQEKLDAEYHLEILQNMFQKHGNDKKGEFIRNMGIVKDIVHLHQKRENAKANFPAEVDDILNKLSIKKYISITNGLYPGFTGKLKEKFPSGNLTELETATCCLMVCGFSNGEIALFTRKKKDTQAIEKMKNRIRRKLSVPEKQNMQEFLLEICRKK